MLETSSLTVHLQDKRVLSNISLTFPQGYLFGILGPNGAGKSTLLKALTAIWPLSSGEVLWQGLPLHAAPRRTISQTLTLVPQNSQPPFDFTAWEVAAMGRYPASRMAFSNPEELIPVERALKRVDAWELRDRPITRLSQGERQRILIARALATESPILLCDEPTANLDLRHQLEIWELLAQIAHSGRVVIASSHDLAACERHCDQVAILEKGRLFAVGPFSEVVTASLLSRVFHVTRSTSHPSQHYLLA